MSPLQIVVSGALIVLIAFLGLFIGRRLFPDLFPASVITAEQQILVDHRSVALFDQIPEQYLTAARNLHMLFMDRSVGGNINEGLDCLHTRRSACTRGLNGESYNPDAAKYNRENWDFEFWPSGCGNGFWDGNTQCFLDRANQTYLQYDVLSYQLSYLEVAENSYATTDFFLDNPNKTDVYDLLAFEAAHPDKTMIYWTTSLARGVGTQMSTNFNNQMRQFTADRQKILFDVADIESHLPDGSPCYDNRDGVSYCAPNSTNCENNPDDGQSYPALCQAYTRETNGGHLGNPDLGKIRIAKAYWVLMAQIAGWVPSGNPVTPQPTVISSPTIAPTVSVPTSTPRPTIGDVPNNTPTPTPPSSATLTLSSTASCSQVSNSWNSLTNATGYFVDRCANTQANCAGAWTQKVVNQNSLSYIDNTVSNDQVYTYRLRARRTDGTFTSFSYSTVTPSCN